MGIFIAFLFFMLSSTIYNTNMPVVQGTMMMALWGAAVGAAMYISALPYVGLFIIGCFSAAVCVVFFLSGHPVLIGSIPVVLVMSMAMIDLIFKNYSGLKDIVRSRTMIERMRQTATDQAVSDVLTGLANRRRFDILIEELADYANKQFAVAIIDLDGFKPINDIYGHKTGDAILKSVGERLRAAMQDNMTAFRMGGDEFAFIFQNVADTKMVVELTSRAISALQQQPYQIDTMSVSIGASAGVSFWSPGKTADQVVAEADMAMYKSKQAARGEVVVYSSEIGSKAKRQAVISQGMRVAIKENQFTTVVQPIVSLKKSRIEAGEVLARWQHDVLGPVSPVDFIRAAEEAQLIGSLTDQLFHHAASYAKSWPAHVHMSFNLSANQIAHPDGARHFLSTVARSGFSPSMLEVEVTETGIMTDINMARANLNKLREAGVLIALDDFGAGYSTFSYLAEFPIDKVKIDRSLIERVVSDERVFAMFKAVVSMCNTLGIQCLAEGIENAEQLKVADGLGCDYAQGYFLGRPVSHEDFITRLRENPESIEIVRSLQDEGNTTKVS